MKKLLGIIAMLAILAAQSFGLVPLSGVVKDASGATIPKAKLIWTLMGCVTKPIVDGYPVSSIYTTTSDNSGVLQGLIAGTSEISCGGTPSYSVTAYSSLNVVLWTRQYYVPGTTFNISTAPQIPSAPNVPPVNTATSSIPGPPGPTGPTGPKGDTGPAGPTGLNVTAGATMYAYGDSHCSGFGLGYAAQSYTNLIAGSRNWNLTNICVGGDAFRDEQVAFAYATRAIGSNGVTMQNMGTNDVVPISTQQGGNAIAINATNADFFTVQQRAWDVMDGSPSVNFVYGMSCTPTTGTWVGANTVVGTLPTQTAYSSAGGSITCTVSGNRIDVMVFSSVSNVQTFSYTVDGVSQTCSYPVTGTTCSILNTYNTGQSLIADTTHVSAGVHTVVITTTGTVAIQGVMGNDTTIPASSRPLVLSSYVSRFGTANGNYVNHTDALVATIQAVQTTEFAALQADNFNIVPYNYTAPVSDPTAWWNPNDATQTQSDWQHQNFIGHQHVFKCIQNALAAAGR